MDDRHGKFEGDLCVEDLPSANLEHIDQLTLTCKEYIKVLLMAKMFTPTCLLY